VLKITTILLFVLFSHSAFALVQLKGGKYPVMVDDAKDILFKTNAAMILERVVKSDKRYLSSRHDAKTSIYATVNKDGNVTSIKVGYESGDPIIDEIVSDILPTIKKLPKPSPDFVDYEAELILKFKQ